MKKITFLAFIAILSFKSVNAQVLFSEDFNSYTIGNIGTDITGVTPGQDNWYTNSHFPGSSVKNNNFRIESENGRGKFLLLESTTIEERGIGYETNKSAIKNIGSFWSLRDFKNNILKIEFEFNYFLYSYDDLDGITMEITENSYPFSKHGIHTGSVYNDELYQIYNSLSTSLAPALFAQQNTWQKIIIYVDYDNYKSYFEFPTKNYAIRSNRIMGSDNPFNYLLIKFFLRSTDNFYGQSFLKIDNIKISAVNTLPTLNIIDLDSSKFNLFPNPATDIVTIANNDNMFVNQIEIHDLSGKLINTQNFNSETNIKVNIEALKSGTYLLHLHTDAGTAIKKLIKK